MRRISIFSLLTLLFLSCNNDSNKNESLTEANSPSEPKVIELTYFDCGTPVSNPFESLKRQVNTIQTHDSLIIAYNFQLDSLILNWDSLVSSENFQISEMKKMRIYLNPVSLDVFYLIIFYINLQFYFFL